MWLPHTGLNRLLWYSSLPTSCKIVRNARPSLAVLHVHTVWIYDYTCHEHSNYLVAAVKIFASQLPRGSYYYKGKRQNDIKGAYIKVVPILEIILYGDASDTG